MPKPSPQPSQPASTPADHPRALGAVRLSNVTKVTTSPGRQRACIQQRTEQLGFALIAEATDLGVSAREMSPFERPSLSPWMRRPDAYDAIVWSHVDRAVRSVAHMSELIEWGQQHATTLVFGMPEERQPLVVTSQAHGDAIRRCMNLAYAAEQESRALSARLTGAHAVLRATDRYGGGLVPFGYKKAPHPSGIGWCLAPDHETVSVVRAIVDDVHSDCPWSPSLTNSKARAFWCRETDTPNSRGVRQAGGATDANSSDSVGQRAASARSSALQR